MSQHQHYFPIASGREVWATLYTQLKTVPRGRIVGLGAMVLLALNTWCSVYVAKTLGRVVDIVKEADTNNPQAAVQEVGWFGLELGCIALLAAICLGIGLYMLTRVLETIINTLRQQLMTQALDMPLHEVEDAGTGDLISRSTDDVAELSQAMSEAIPSMVNTVLYLLAALVGMLVIEWQFLMAPLVAMGWYGLVAWKYLQIAPQRYAEERAAVADRAHQLLEAVRGRPTLSAYRLGPFMLERFERTSATVAIRAIRARLSVLIILFGQSLGEVLMLLLTLGVSYRLVTEGQVTLGAATGASLLMIKLRGPISGFLRTVDDVQAAYAALSRIVGVVLHPPTPVPGVESSTPVGRVELHNVSFSYGDGWAVRDLSFQVEPGTQVAVVGASGAGKSTIAALLAGLRVPDSGQVLVDAHPISNYSDAQRRARIALLSQEVYVFSGTLREDLALANPLASDEAMIDALRSVHADWFDTLPDGLDTPIGARGHQLNAFEAQQLALARVKLLSPAVVILDEATAEAGSAGAMKLEAAAQSITTGRTSIVIAHRLEAARLADHILVIDQGRIIQQGSHEELQAQTGSVYQQLWQSWEQGRVEHS